MTILREAAEAALEQLKINRTNFRKGPSKSICKRLAGGNDEVILALEAALAEPVQEPVAWIHTDANKPSVKFLEWREDEPGYRGDWLKTPLYTAPTQRAHGIGGSDVGT